MAAAVLNVLMAIVLHRMYVSGITKPIRRIEKNGKLLSQRQPLLPEMSGTNELSRLDQLLHAISDEVEQMRVKERALIRNSADLICSVDKDRRFIEVNDFAEELLGFAPDELCGMSIDDLISPEQSFFAEEQLRKATESRDVTNFDLTLRRPDSTTIDTRWSTMWASGADTWFCVVHDITEEKKAAKARQDLISMISHELRAPLTAMYGSVELVLSVRKYISHADSRQQHDEIDFCHVRGE